MNYFLLFFLFFIGHGVYFSSLSPYTHTAFGSDSWLVFLAGQISFPFGYFLSGYISDRFRVLRGFMVVSLLIHAPAQYFLFSFPENLHMTIALSGITRFLFAVNFQLITIAALEGAGQDNFGKKRSLGTVSFFLIHLYLFLAETNLLPLPMLEDSQSQGSAGRLGLVFHLFTALVALTMPRHRRSHEAYFFKDAMRVLLRGRVALFFLVSFLFFVSYQLVDYYLGQYLNRKGGMSLVYLGWCLAVVFEIPFLPLTARILRRYNLNSLFLLATGAGALRFLWLSLDTLGASPVPIVFSQLLHGIQFTGYYMGGIFFLRRFFPEHLYGTGSGAYTVICAALGGMVGNLVYGRILYSDIALFPTAWAPALGSEFGPFFPLFFSAFLIQAALFFGFIFMPAPPELER